MAIAETSKDIPKIRASFMVYPSAWNTMTLQAPLHNGSAAAWHR